MRIYPIVCRPIEPKDYDSGVADTPGMKTNQGAYGKVDGRVEG